MAHSPSGWTDNRLLTAISEDNIQAFEVLFERYAERLNDFALRYVRDACVAEELMMDIMHWLWQHRKQLTEVRDVAAYLFRAIRNKVFDHLRKAYLETVPLSVLPEEGDLIADPVLPSQALELSELQKQYEQSLLQLPPQCRKVFELSRDQQLSHAEISSKLNISVKTVEGHITSALKVLRRNLPPPTDMAYLVLACYFLP